MPLNIPALLLVLLLCAILALRLLRQRTASRLADARWPFYLRRLLPDPHQVLYQRLVSALPDHTVLAGVELASVLGVRRGSDPVRWLRRLRHQQYDFVVCAKDSSVLAAIELEDRPGSGKGLLRSDGVKERASAAAGLRLIRWQSRALPDQKAIREAFGEEDLPFFEQPASSANQSWWPPIAGRHPPAI